MLENNNFINFVDKTKQINCLQINNESICIFAFYGDGGRNPSEIERHKKVLDYHQKIFSYFNLPINYVYNNFDYNSFGGAIDNFVRQVVDNVDYLYHFDIDAIPLRKNVIYEIYEKIKDKNTVWGISQQSNHIIKQNGTKQHIYCSFSSFAISKLLYKKIGSPSFQSNKRGDIAEEITWRVQEQGYNFLVSFCKSFELVTPEEQKTCSTPAYWELDNGLKFGMGGRFSDLVYHSGMQGVPRSTDLFINECQEILKESKEKKIEAIIICKSYADYLDITLPINKKYFDNIIIVTAKDDYKTQEICFNNSLNWLVYDDFNKNGAKFNFGGARQFGLNHSKYRDWIVFIDSDVIIEEDFRDRLIDKDKFYGSYRRFIPTIRDYQDLTNGKKKQEEFEAILGHGCGFFQCLNLNNSKSKQIGINNIYNDSFSAEQCDINMLRKFCPFDIKTSKYEDLVDMDIELWHLGDPGVNNNGRNEQDNFFK
jgi:hypothetical protein